MPNCPQCGGWASKEFARVLGNNDDELQWCQNCQGKVGYRPQEDDDWDDESEKAEWKNVSK